MIVDEPEAEEKSSFTAMSLQTRDLEEDGLAENQLWERFYQQNK
ncbi:hypothetical protein [uncultured Mucilaginibacter sp.]|nr:hypothetical protein [uncultured Mucilaginibacter sp.]